MKSKTIAALKMLLECAAVLGMREEDLKKAQDLFGHNEYGLCFELITTQMYEHKIGINKIFFALADEIASHMKLPHERYSFMMELLPDETDTPESEVPPSPS
jgi:hypothetical protein